jgi:inositol-pentakisphosphate 2-kinase
MIIPGPFSRRTRHLWLIPSPDKLLRVRKDLPTTLPCAVSHAAWLRIIAPIFCPDQLVQQSLIELRPAALLKRLNAELRHWEQNPRPINRSSSSPACRPMSRQGVYLANDDYGLLVTDMTCSKDVLEQQEPWRLTAAGRKEGEEVVEFKPKWLTQSLSAPANSNRCRQCAHVARVNAKRSRTGEPRKALFCPLDLVSNSSADLRRVSSQLVGPNRSLAMIERFAKWLETNTLLRNLLSYQKRLDQKGVLVGDVDDENFLAAMTLRDCTVFVKFHSEETGKEVEARLGDLDLKSRAKKEYWRRTELELIEEGWYEGKESRENAQPLVCQLSHERWSRERIGESLDNG